MRELFELFGVFYFEDFSDVCNETGSYFFLLFLVIFVTGLFNFIYYFLLDSSIYNQNQYYFLLVGICFFMIFFISYQFLHFQISSQNLVFPRIGFLSMSFLSGIYSIIFFILESILLKNFSKNSYRIPF